jgi:hypothetical protein
VNEPPRTQRSRRADGETTEDTERGRGEKERPPPPLRRQRGGRKHLTPSRQWGPPAPLHCDGEGSQAHDAGLDLEFNSRGCPTTPPARGRFPSHAPHSPCRRPRSRSGSGFPRKSPAGRAAARLSPPTSAALTTRPTARIRRVLQGASSLHHPARPWWPPSLSRVSLSARRQGTYPRTFNSAFSPHHRARPWPHPLGPAAIARSNESPYHRYGPALTPARGDAHTYCDTLAWLRDNSVACCRGDGGTPPADHSCRPPSPSHRTEPLLRAAALFALGVP